MTSPINLTPAATTPASGVPAGLIPAPGSAMPGDFAMFLAHLALNPAMPQAINPTTLLGNSLPGQTSASPSTPHAVAPGIPAPSVGGEKPGDADAPSGGSHDAALPADGAALLAMQAAALHLAASTTHSPPGEPVPAASGPPTPHDLSAPSPPRAAGLPPLLLGDAPPTAGQASQEMLTTENDTVQMVDARSGMAGGPDAQAKTAFQEALRATVPAQPETASRAAVKPSPAGASATPVAEKLPAKLADKPDTSPTTREQDTKPAASQGPLSASDSANAAKPASAGAAEQAPGQSDQAHVLASGAQTVGPRSHATRADAPAETVTKPVVEVLQNRSDSQQAGEGSSGQSEHSARRQPESTNPSLSLQKDRSFRAADPTAALQADAPRTDSGVAATARLTTKSPDEQAVGNTVRVKSTLGGRQVAPVGDRLPSPGADPSAGLASVPGAHAQSDAPVSRTAAPNPLSAPGERVRVVEQVAQKIETLRLSQGRQEVTLHLRPEHLGDLHLTITADRSTINARIVAETAAVRQVVEEGRDQLRASLEQKGFSLQGLDVSLQNGGGQRSTPFVPDWQPSPARAAFPDAIEPEAQPAAVGAANASLYRSSRLDCQA